MYRTQSEKFENVPLKQDKVKEGQFRIGLSGIICVKEKKTSFGRNALFDQNISPELYQEKIVFASYEKTLIFRIHYIIKTESEYSFYDNLHTEESIREKWPKILEEDWFKKLYEAS